MFKYQLNQLPFILIALLIAFTVHEFAHAWTAWRFGDPTAKNAGRLTLNPAPHLDLVGTLLILIVGFGWAKPVPVNPAYFRNPRLAGTLVTFAGPLANLVTAFVTMFLLFLLLLTGAIHVLPDFWQDFVQTLLQVIIHLNVVLFFFNLIPLPFFDGYFIIRYLAPDRIGRQLSALEPYALLIFLVIVLTPIGNYFLDPIFNILVPDTIDYMFRFFLLFVS